MKNEIVQQGVAISSLSLNSEALIELNNFQTKVNRKPRANNIKRNDLTRSNYLDIEYIEATLDEVYMGVWQTHSFVTQVVANELVGSMILEVFHPVANHWIRRVGSASVPIQFKKNSDITDISNKIKNALVKNAPTLKSECLKNAAKSLGKRFGRDLNREGRDYKPQFHEAKIDPAQQESIDKITILIEHEKVTDDLASGITVMINEGISEATAERLLRKLEETIKK